MDLYVNGRFLTRRITGVDRFARENMTAIDAMLANDDPLVRGLRVRILVPPGEQVDHDYRHIEVQTVGTRQGAAWEQLDLARAVPKGELLLSLCNTGPAFRRDHVVVIHDAGTERMPQGFSRGFRWWYRVLMPLLGRNARRVLTVSSFAQNELKEVFGVPLSRSAVVPVGIEHMQRVAPDPDTLQRHNLAQTPYFLAVSSLAAHKNFQLLLDALALMESPPFHVAIAGGANARIFGGKAAADSSWVRWLGYVSDAELRALYGGALGFVFPSLYEGYGLPPIEAMASGCPVLASNAASIPEVCGDAALYFDPRDPAALQALMLKLAADAPLRAEMAERGRQRAARDSWDKVARAVLAGCGIVASQQQAAAA